MNSLHWGDESLAIELAWDDASAVGVRSIRSGGAHVAVTDVVPLVEILTVGAGHEPASDRLDHTQIGRSLRYVAHVDESDATRALLRVTQRDAVRGIEATITLESPNGSGCIRAEVEVVNVGRSTAVLRSVTSWSSGFGDLAGGHVEASVDATEPVDSAGPADRSGFESWSLVSGTGEWLGENRWSRRGMREAGIAAIREDLTGHDRRSSLGAVSYGTWSTGGALPVAGIESTEIGAAWLWQIEHNGGWRWEIGENRTGGVFSLSGPTDRDHSFTLALAPGERFTTVPVTVAFASTFTAALENLTGYRRGARLPHLDNERLSVVFNDYMNTLNGDPTTERLLPLVDAAAEVGAEIFCIDAGWYDDSGSWWGSVGEWQPSTVRFPAGLDEVIEHIRSRGMTPGLWLEPEVVGVRSPLVDRLPDEAFLQRFGERVEEHDRYHLDLRHPAVIAHLDAVVDRLVDDFGIGFFKFDYNVNPGAGTDLDADSPGHGLLLHNRAHLAWLDAVLERHPELIIENCSSGAMRMDFAMLSRLQMQSTSDQQDFRLYPPIAAAAPLSMLPEQAASWAYPQPEMTEEEVAFCLVTGLLGRYYLSGYLNRMTPAQRALVREAVAAAKQLRGAISRSTPFWPTGLPNGDGAVSLGLADGQTLYASVWNRGGSEPIRLELPRLRGHDVIVDTVFPRELAEWTTKWNGEEGILTVRAVDAETSARTFRITPSTA
ncbi:glycoside hydrolase family 36 protein [Agromyces sp. ISL-38]|uniref:glycoside hydrolase family 36 protein n=1 Tax=Agromyces sp. ISL-38 TaxID=2819107 RepID=UPI001BE680EE|nr:glycoside hydrolase family 36 protein [Agromyces sp. ISL-38]MBT2518266.1 alpha-galactosidase [Streptomyces sp. ISL-90]